MGNTNKSIYDELSDRIVNSPQFDTYLELIKTEILYSLDLDCNNIKLTFEQVKFLIEAASILSLSSDDKYKQYAYYIVILINNHYHQYYDKLYSITKLILIRLGNFPACALLCKLLDNKNSDGVQCIPLPLVHETVLKYFSNSINLNGKKIELTDFQKEFFEKLSENNELSCSAPTSAGKSFLLAIYVVNILREKDKLNIVYVVPTKALINQVKRDIKKYLMEYEVNDIEILSSTTTFELELEDKHKIDKCILILTQERLSYLLGNKEIDFPIDILIIDEAQKVSEGSRGVILERAIINTLRQNIATKVVFSAPLASNPDFFKSYKSTIIPIKTTYSPVAQNIIFVNSKRKEDFLSVLFENQRKILINRSELVNDCPKGANAKVAYWAYKLGEGKLNIVYRNRPTDTETLAEALCQYLPVVENKKIDEFIEYIKEEVHSQYTLIKCLRKGVVFHYSTMPREIKDKIEELFADEEIPVRYLCCTSTLLEGMNLPATNIFIHKPQKGINKNMQKIDFWNLAGRAGRLLKDFYGNIFCIDVDEWEGYVPESIMGDYLIESATEDSISKKTEDIIKYLNNIKEPFPIKEKELLEQATSMFVMNYIEDDGITFSRFIEERKLSIKSESVDKISTAISQIAKNNLLPLEVLDKNIGIDTRLQNELYKYFAGQFYLTLIPKHPLSGKEFYYSLLNIYKIIDEIFLNGSDAKILPKYAVLSSQWINEQPLSSLIRYEIDYLKEKHKFISVNSSVRNIVQTIENILTYKYAKYLKCYSDILDYYLIQSGKDVPHIRRLPTNLELGAMHETTISLISFGLSRTTAIKLRKLIGMNDLNRSDCRQWLDNYYYRMKESLPAICQDEFENNCFI
jgi:superfamily II DNA/RNA helicase